MTDDLTDLLRLAEAATPNGWPSSQALEDCQIYPADAAFIAAVSPDVVARLVERVKAAEAAENAEYMKRVRMQARADAAEKRVAELEREIERRDEMYDLVEAGALAAEAREQALRDRVTELAAGVVYVHASSLRALLSPPTAHVYVDERCVECGVNCYDAMLHGPEFCRASPPTADTEESDRG